MMQSKGVFPTVRLDPGEIFIGSRPAEVHTLLGSCVAVVLHNPRLQVGSICHGRLASRACDQPPCGLKICHDMGDYVTCAIRFMLAYFEQHGSQRRELEVKIFGGAKMFEVSPTGGANETVGKRNVDAAMAVIRAERLHLLSSDVGGGHGRTLIFNSASGEVMLKRTRDTFKQG